VFREPEDDTNATVDTLVRCARIARAHGILALEEHAERHPDPLLQKALRLAVDGTDSRHVRQIVALEITNEEERDHVPARVFEALGGYAPTFGILGAVLGLIHVMENLANPANLGAGIATAFVATVYGVGAANLVFLPIAAKLKERAEKRAVRGEMILEGVLAIQEGLSPRLVEEKLQTYRPAASRGPHRVGRAA
jgi:chemotaxis protein MotA